MQLHAAGGHRLFIGQQVVRCIVRIGICAHKTLEKGCVQSPNQVESQATKQFHRFVFLTCRLFSSR